MDIFSKDQQLWELSRILQLRAMDCLFVDTKQRENLRSLFTPEATLEGMGSAPVGAGLDAWIKVVSTRLKEATTGVMAKWAPQVGETIVANAVSAVSRVA